MVMNKAVEALRLGRVLALQYDRYSRLVEVHAVGHSLAGHAVMRAYQIGGGSVSGQPIGWKLLRLDEAFSATVSDKPSAAPRPGYRRGDKDMTSIVAQV